VAGVDGREGGHGAWLASWLTFATFAMRLVWRNLTGVGLRLVWFFVSSLGVLAQVGKRC
jgi:hypothetical protein